MGNRDFLDPEAVLPRLLRRRARECGERLYLQRVEGGQLSYGEFHREALRWADALERLGARAGEQVGGLLPTGFDAALALVGCGWLKARWTAINTAYRARLLDNVLANAAPRLLLIDSRYLPQLASVDLAATAVRTVVVLDQDAPAPLGDGIRVCGRREFLAGAEARERDGPEPWDVASIIYTSGTTGPSKGVLVHWAQLHATAGDASLDDFTADDCWYSPLPMFHVGGQSSLYKMALAGGRLVLREAFSLDHFFADIERFAATATVLMESMIPLLTARARQGFRKPASLRCFILVPVPENIDAFKTLFGVRIATMYNQTEVSGPISSHGFRVDDTMARSCGWVRPGCEVRVVDEHDRPLGPGQVGELIVRADQPWVLNGGYLNDAAATAKAWRNGWFHTGDGFRYDEEGRFYFVDRLKDYIRRRGENISSLEVEAEIAAHPAVVTSAVVAARSETGDEEVKAFIVRRDGATLDPVELIDFLRGRLPHFMIPRYLEFVDELPRTPSQKVQKHLLRERGNGERTWDREAHGIVVKRNG